MTNNTPTIPIGGSKATLSDGTTKYDFLFPPEKLEWTIDGKYAVNQPLYSQRPQATFLTSSAKLSFPRVIFMSPGMNRDMTEFLNPLRTWARSGVVLSLSYGHTKVIRCHLVNIRINETQWRQGLPTQVEASLEFMEVADRVAAPTGNVGNTVYTLRERRNISEKVTQALKNPAQAYLLGLPEGTYIVNVDETGTATAVLGKKVTNIPLQTLKTNGVI